MLLAWHAKKLKRIVTLAFAIQFLVTMTKIILNSFTTALVTSNSIIGATKRQTEIQTCRLTGAFIFVTLITFNSIHNLSDLQDTLNSGIFIIAGLSNLDSTNNLRNLCKLRRHVFRVNKIACSPTSGHVIKGPQTEHFVSTIIGCEVAPFGV